MEKDKLPPANLLCDACAIYRNGSMVTPDLHKPARELVKMVKGEAPYDEDQEMSLLGKIAVKATQLRASKDIDEADIRLLVTRIFEYSEETEGQAVLQAVVFAVDQAQDEGEIDEVGRVYFIESFNDFVLSNGWKGDFDAVLQTAYSNEALRNLPEPKMPGGYGD